MAATNDTRLGLKQVVRAVRGGRRARNKVELALHYAELAYLDRLLCGHLEEAAHAFAALWTNKKTRRRLRKVMVLTDPGRAALKTLEREFLNPPADSFRKTFLQTVRNDWAFHYRKDVYATALPKVPDTSLILIAPAHSGLSRYLMVDDVVMNGTIEAAGKTAEDYNTAMRKTVVLAGALGTVVDSLVLGLLGRPGFEILRQHDYVVTLEAGLARGQREAVARREDRPAPAVTPLHGEARG